jgi:hypothetical protein
MPRSRPPSSDPHRLGSPAPTAADLGDAGNGLGELVAAAGH